MTTIVASHEANVSEAGPDFLIRCLTDLSFRRKMENGGAPSLFTAKMFREWHINSERLFAAFKADECSMAFQIYDPYQWFHFHRKFWASNNTKDPLYRRLIGEMITHISDALASAKFRQPVPIDWEAEFDRIDIGDEELQGWAFLSVVREPDLFPHPISDLAANREVLRKVSKEKFSRVFMQTRRS